MMASHKLFKMSKFKALIENELAQQHRFAAPSPGGRLSLP